MKSNLTILPLSVLLLAAEFSVRAANQTNLTETLSTTSPAPASPAPGAGLVNDWLRSESGFFDVFDLGGQFRVRYEYKSHFAVPGRPGAVDFLLNSPVPENDYWLFRTKVHLGYTPCDWFSIYGEGRNSSEADDQRNPNPEADGPFDFNQGYVIVGNAKEFPVLVKVGRQELNYGDQRLVGSSDWNNIGRVWDAAKVRYENQDIWVDGFVANLVIPRANDFNDHNSHEYFSGVYASTKTLIPRQETQLYFLADNADAESASIQGTGVNGSTPRDIYTVGARVHSTPGEWSGWDYEMEAAGQFGNFAMTATGPRLNDTAYAFHTGGGYTWTEVWGAPRVGLAYNQASGDDNPTDGKHTTFVNLFPTNHRFYGYMDFFSWQNMRNPHLAASVAPAKSTTVTLDYNAFWLTTTSDYFYQVNGQPRTTGGYGINPAAGNFVGQEIDLVATYTVKTYGSIQAGYGHFFVGNYVKYSLSAPGRGATDANFVYAQALLNF